MTAEEQGGLMEGKVLVAYGSKYGATKEIAEKIGETLTGAGLQVDVMAADQVSEVSSYNAFVIGSGVYIGLWQKDAVKFVVANEKTLTGKPVWFFSSGPTGANEKVENAFMPGDNLPRKLKDVAARINPRGIIIFKGAVESERLKGFSKWIIKRVEASKDETTLGDFRDWEVIASWAQEIAAALG
jgi:menaquinone-dependent protoporphyrinogen oxidase